MNQRPMQPADDHTTEIIVVAGTFVLSIVGANWLAGNLAALAIQRRPLGAPFGKSFDALTRLPDHMGDPGQAWAEPFASRLPGPFIYWPAVVLVLAAFGVVGTVAFRWLGGHRHESPDRRKRLGVEHNRAWPRPPTWRRCSLWRPHRTASYSGNGIGDGC
jgi:hypothetical protein